MCACVPQSYKPHRWEIHGVHQQYEDVPEVRIQRKRKDHPLDRSTYDDLKILTQVHLKPSPPPFTCMCTFCAGVLPAEGGSSQRRSE